MLMVSIRAPAKGATSSGAGSRPSRGVSIRAPAKGATLRSQSDSLHAWGFQSAPPRRGRPGGHGFESEADQSSFNPRPRVGGRRLSMRSHMRIIGRAPVSIRAPAKGATPWPLDGQGVRAVRFNPRPRVGGDVHKRSLSAIDRQGVSIRAPAWGATTLTSSSKSMPVTSSFQSAPPRGGRRRHVAKARGIGLRRFNPRPRVGGDVPTSGAHGGSRIAFQSAPPRGGRPTGRMR